MAFDLKAATPDTSLPTSGFLFGADSQVATDPSIYPAANVAATLASQMVGGTSGQMQYHDGTDFGGMAGTSWDDTNRSLTVTGATVTTSNPVLNLSQTWNAAVTFTALTLNVTDTSSNLRSLLADFQVGGTSQFVISKNASASGVSLGPLNGNDTPGSGFIVNAGLGLVGNNGVSVVNGAIGLLIRTNNTALLHNTMTLSWGNTSAVSQDLILARDAANTLALRNATNAQTFNVYNTYTDASNYERLATQYSSNIAYIASTAAGTGTSRSLRLYAGAAGFGSGGYIDIQASGTISFALSGTATRWTITSSGNFIGAVDNTYDIGASGATRPRTGYFGTSVVSPSYAMSDAISAAAWTTSGIGLKETARTLTDTSSSGTVAAAYTHTLGGNTIAASSATTFTDYFSTFLSEPTAGTNVTLTRKWALGLSGSMQLTGNINFTGNNAITRLNSTALAFAGNVQIHQSPVVMNNVTLNWTPTSSVSGIDLVIARDAANTLALRNSTAAQTFNVYNTYTDASNYERFTTNWSSNVLYLRNQNAGTGSARLMVPVTGSTTVASLPAASTAGAGARAFVTDATATTFLSTVAGSGANAVPVVSDGTNWLIG